MINARSTLWHSLFHTFTSKASKKWIHPLQYRATSQPPSLICNHQMYFWVSRTLQECVWAYLIRTSTNFEARIKKLYSSVRLVMKALTLLLIDLMEAWITNVNFGTAYKRNLQPYINERRVISTTCINK